jgi:hypothetical protein
MKTSKTNQHSAADLLPVRRDATRQHTFIKLLGRDTGVKLNVFSKKKNYLRVSLGPTFPVYEQVGFTEVETTLELVHRND